MQDIVKIFDTTLRDGEQSPGFSMNTEEKLRLAVQLEKLGVDIIEAGFPIASEDDFLAVKLISEKIENSEVCGLSRAVEKDIKRAWEAIKFAKKPRIHTFIATSPIHMEYKLKMTPSVVIKNAVNAVKFAKSFTSNVEFSCEDAGRSDKNFLKEILEAVIEAGANTLNIPDTVGYLMPEEYGKLIKFLIENIQGANSVTWSTHCHNDLGLGVANSLEGVKNGARQIECTINGIGERAGNAAVEEIAMAIKLRKDFYNLKTNINTKEIYPTSNLLKKITGQSVQLNKSIVGENAFAHESGIHQHGFLANSETYEIMKPEDVGFKESKLVLGKHSGRAAIKDRLEKLGYNLSEEKLNSFFIEFKNLADKKKTIEDIDLDVLVLGLKDKKDVIKLISYSVQTSNNKKPSATIKLQFKYEIKEVSCEGDGPVDASFKAIESIVGCHGQLVDFRMDAVTTGLDAQAIVSLTLLTESNKKIFGRNGDTDIVLASINAYIDALNKFFSYKDNI